MLVDYATNLPTFIFFLWYNTMVYPKNNYEVKIYAIPVSIRRIRTPRSHLP